MKDLSIEQFLDDLFSKKPIPGGGGASALVAAVGIALGGMVGNLTLGKKKYANVQDEIEEILKAAEKLQHELEDLIQKDAENFEPLAKAYGLPKSTPEEKAYKEKVLEEALYQACQVPLEIMRKCVESIDLHARLEKIGNKLAISDVGVGVVFLKAALEGASLNVFINTKMMKNDAVRTKINEEAYQLIEEGKQKADEIFQRVAKQFE